MQTGLWAPARVETAKLVSLSVPALWHHVSFLCLGNMVFLTILLFLGHFDHFGQNGPNLIMRIVYGHYVYFAILVSNIACLHPV
jgi:hypothetical protein